MGDFITPEQLATHLQRDLDSASATQAIANAEAQVRAYTEQTISAVASDTVTLDGCPDRWLDLPQRPVTAVTTVKIDGVTVTDFTLRKGRLYRAAGWGTHTLGLPPLVEVTYSHGYATIPQDVQDVTLQAATRRYTNPQGNTSETTGPFAFTRQSAAAMLLEDERRALRRFRRPAKPIQML